MTNKTLTSSSYYHARHLSKLIPLGQKTPEKKAAVHKLMQAIKVMLKENS